MASHSQDTISKGEDTDRLAELGYSQELRRTWSLLHNFGVSFSIISCITGITTLFEYGLTTGGPGVMSIGWICVSFFTMFVAVAMAEIVSSNPSAGGPYHWAAILSPTAETAAFTSWVTGWFNFLGQVAITTGVSFGCAQLVSVLAAVKSGFVATPARTIGIYAAILISHATLNTFGVKLLKYFNNISVLLNSVGVCCFAIAVLAKAPNHQSPRFVFASFYDGTGDPGWSIRASRAYVAVTGILMSQYTITGFDASAHLSEETKNASWNAPMGVLSAVGCSALFGFFLIISLLFSIQNFETTVDSKAGNPVLQILLDIFGETGAIILFTLVLMCIWHCGLFSLTSNSRMMFAFARDGALPPIFRRVNPSTGTPVNTVWLAALLAFLLALPSLGSSVAFTAATSIATIGLYVSYVIPVLIKLIYPATFAGIMGPFNLVRYTPNSSTWFSQVVSFVAVAYVVFLTIIFCLPQQNPVNSQSLNYTPVAVGIVALWSLSSWFLWAKRWFKGPSRQVLQQNSTDAGGPVDADLKT